MKRGGTIALGFNPHSGQTIDGLADTVVAAGFSCQRVAESNKGFCVLRQSLAVLEGASAFASLSQLTFAGSTTCERLVRGSRLGGRGRRSLRNAGYLSIGLE